LFSLILFLSLAQNNVFLHFNYFEQKYKPHKRKRHLKEDAFFLKNLIFLTFAAVVAVPAYLSLPFALTVQEKIAVAASNALHPFAVAHAQNH